MMKNFLVTIVILMQSLICHAQNSTIYQPNGKNVEIDEYEDKLLISFDFNVNELTQDHFPLSEFNKTGFHWKEFLDYAFGNNMDPFHSEMTDKVSEKINSYALKHHLNGEELLGLIIAFSNSLKSPSSSIGSNNLYYYPYEIFLNGIHSDSERISVFASLLSAFCFDITFTVYNGGFDVMVLSTDGDISFKGAEYKALNDYSAQKTAEIIPFSERCEYKSIRFSPVSVPENLSDTNLSFEKSYRVRDIRNDSNTLSFDIDAGDREMSYAGQGSNKAEQQFQSVGYIFSVVDSKIQCTKTIRN